MSSAAEPPRRWSSQRRCSLAKTFMQSSMASGKRKGSAVAKRALAMSPQPEVLARSPFSHSPALASAMKASSRSGS